MPGVTAFYDASVLYPSELRNLPVHLALTGMFRAKWSAAVHEEWIGALLRHRPDLSRANPILTIGTFSPRQFADEPT